MGLLGTLSHPSSKAGEKSENEQAILESAEAYDSRELVDVSEAEFNELFSDLYKIAEDQCNQIISDIKKASETDLEYAEEAQEKAKAELEEKARIYEEILAKAEAERQARENNRQMKTIKHFRLHIDTGDIYAIEQRADASVVGSCGPLDEDDLKDLDSYDYSKKKNRWVRKNLKQLILWFP